LNSVTNGIAQLIRLWVWFLEVISLSPINFKLLNAYIIINFKIYKISFDKHKLIW
jgi:hypothetical protein